MCHPYVIPVKSVAPHRVHHIFVRTSIRWSAPRRNIASFVTIVLHRFARAARHEHLIEPKITESRSGEPNVVGLKANNLAARSPVLKTCVQPKEHFCVSEPHIRKIVRCTVFIFLLWLACLSLRIIHSARKINQFSCARVHAQSPANVDYTGANPPKPRRMSRIAIELENWPRIWPRPPAKVHADRLKKLRESESSPSA